MANRRRPPSSIPPPRSSEGPPNVVAEGLTMLADMIGQALEKGVTEVSRTLKAPFAGGLAGSDDEGGMLDARLRVRTVDAASAETDERWQSRRSSSGTGDSHPVADGPQMREPLVDVFDEGSEIVVAAEVPGCGLEDLDIVLDDDGTGLTVTASGARGFRRRVALPAAADPVRMESSCKNGVLEVRLNKSDADPDPAA